MATPYSVPQNFSTTLNVAGGITAIATSGIVLTSVSGLPTDGGILCFDWAASLDTSVAEYVEYTGISGNELTGVVRGAEGVAGKAHSNGCTIVGVISQAHIKRLKDKVDGTDAVALQDVHGNEVLKTAHVDSAVNELTISNNATGSAPIISATGGDTNIDLSLTAKGTGKVIAISGIGSTRITKRVTAIASNANPTINTDNCDVVDITAQAADIASMTTNLSGTPTNFQTLIIRFKDNATARAITWGASFEAKGTALPTTTVISKVLTVGFIYDTTTSKWGCVASAQEA